MPGMHREGESLGLRDMRKQEKRSVMTKKTPALGAEHVRNRESESSQKERERAVEDARSAFEHAHHAFLSAQMRDEAYPRELDHLKIRDAALLRAYETQLHNVNPQAREENLGDWVVWESEIGNDTLDEVRDVLDGAEARYRELLSRGQRGTALIDIVDCLTALGNTGAFARAETAAARQARKEGAVRMMPLQALNQLKRYRKQQREVERSVV